MRTYRAHPRLSVTIVRYVWFRLGARRPVRAILGPWGGRRLSEPRQAGRPVRQSPAPLDDSGPQRQRHPESEADYCPVFTPPHACPGPDRCGMCAAGPRRLTGPTEWLPNGVRPVSKP